VDYQDTSFPAWIGNAGGRVYAKQRLLGKSDNVKTLPLQDSRGFIGHYQILVLLCTGASLCEINPALTVVR
jgi:hypothetical protein